jgi:pyruvate dehydrogenase E2 component (dihydrolipoamide acetyltransferase)
MECKQIYAVVVPKWGLTMEEGLLAAWHVAEGAQVAAGDVLADIETEKIANALEAHHAGVLRRRIGSVGERYPCGAVIGIIAAPGVPEAEITAFAAEHSQAPAAQPGEAGAVPQLIELDRRRLRFLTLGTGGVPILFLHGLAGDLNNWMFVQPALSQARATYALDLPGHGGSSKDMSGIQDLTDVADLSLAFLDRLAIGQVHVVGHSLGAAIGILLASRHPERVQSLALLGPVGLGVPPAAKFLEGLVSATSRREMSALTQTLLADERKPTRDMIDDLLKYKRLDGVEAALRRYAELMAIAGPSLPLAGIKTTVHAIWGAGDRVIPPPAAADLPPNVVLTVLEGAGHLPHVEKSAETVAVIERVLSSPRGLSGTGP